MNTNDEPKDEPVISKEEFLRRLKEDPESGRKLRAALVELVG